MAKCQPLNHLTVKELPR